MSVSFVSLMRELEILLVLLSGDELMVELCKNLKLNENVGD